MQKPASANDNNATVAAPSARASFDKLRDNFLPSRTGLYIVFQKLCLAQLARLTARRDDCLREAGCACRERGETQNGAKPLKTNNARKRRNENDHKLLKTNNRAK
jgi:hypothetical protein